MNSKGTLELIVKEFVVAVAPLRVAVSDVDHFKAFMRNLGWDVTDLPVDYQNLATEVESLIATSESLIANPNLADVLNLLDDIKDLYSTIKNLTSAPAGTISVDFLGEFFNRLFEYLAIEYLDTAVPMIASFLEMADVIKYHQYPATASRPSYSRKELDYQRIPDLIRNPLEFLDLVLQWGTNDFVFPKLLEFLYNFFSSLGFNPTLKGFDPAVPASMGVAWPSGFAGFGMLEVPCFTFYIAGNTYEAGFQIAFFEGDSQLPSNGLILQLYIPSVITANVAFNETWSLQLRALSNLFELFGIIVTPSRIQVRFPGALNTPLPDFGFGAKLIYSPETPKILLGKPSASRLEFAGSELGVEVNYLDLANLEFLADLDFKGFKIVLKGGDGDGFLAKILGDQEKVFETDFGIRWSSLSGFHFKGGGGGFEVALNPHIELGPLRIEQLKLAIKALLSTPGIEVKATADLGLELGPFTAVAEDLGVSLKLKFQEGNAGPFDIRVGFKPPMGIGLSIDASAFKGGGYLFFDYENESYAGVLELTIKETISVKAIGLLTTRFPDGSKGFSLLLMITAEFTPIQLGFGFTLNGVGGMIGINRTMVLSALRDGVKSGSINNIMFPTDPVANATQIISDLKTIFPPQEGRFAFGPMGKIGWGTPTLITMDVGLFIELPAPVRLAIIGIIRMLLPDENKQLLKLQVAFVGTIDFEQKFITFDASIFDSRLLTFTLEGDMAVRIKWGENSNFVFTVGGFHPQYVPPPLQLPTLKRLTINLLGGDNPRLTIQTYFAVTSNTVQFGSRVDFYFKVTGKCKVLGWLGFDALFQFSPFYFNVSFSAGLAVYWKNDPFLSISLTVMLEGPTPWHAKGTAEFKILVFKFKVNFDKTWGQQATTTLPDKAVFAEVKAAIEHRANWLATKSGTTDPLVTLRAIDTSNPNKLLITPDGGLSVSQKVVPMDVTISKFGNQKPSDYNLFHLDLLDGYGNLYVREDVKEEFAPNSFFNLNNSEKLSRPNFERYNGGLKGKAQTEAITSSLFQERDVEYEQILMDNRFTPPLPLGMATIAAASFGVWTKNGSASNSAFGTKVKGESLLRPPKVSVVEKGYSVVDLDAGGVYQSNHAVTFEEAHQKLQEALRVRPELEGQLQILPSHEIA